jgi:hypothetical protein
MFRRLRLALDRRVTVSNLLDELLRRGTNRVVIVEEGFVTLDGAHEPVQRVADMHREVCALGRFLVEDAGFRPGGLAVPPNPLLSLPEARRIVGHCGLDVLVTDRALFEERIGVDGGTGQALPAARLTWDSGQGGWRTPSGRSAVWSSATASRYSSRSGGCASSPPDGFRRLKA